MNLIAEFDIVSPTLRRSIRAVPGTVVTTEDFRRVDGSLHFVFWVDTDDAEAFEAAMGGDETVASFSLLATVDGRRLYRATLSESGESGVLYPSMATLDVTLLDATATEDGTRVRARLPSREALWGLREACEERDVPFHLRGVFGLESVEAGRYGLTESQREALVAAHEAGYYEVPRETSLATVADRLGISTQALSARLRRGQSNLIEHTVVNRD
ncbi:helix-turn-helix domain-containing protein [Halomarina ordinaria]|uniref:Helix-turn-helix domain-containing protein n=1 Tax=Halomarina ordinaria TaxID=3033939 RepID=A0ABD5U921_9EURY|nr:helix-turn-helix domain-containing protein [Halomarina sp. PSRA2]